MSTFELRRASAALLGACLLFKDVFRDVSNLLQRYRTLSVVSKSDDLSIINFLHHLQLTTKSFI